MEIIDNTQPEQSATSAVNTQDRQVINTSQVIADPEVIKQTETVKVEPAKIVETEMKNIVEVETTKNQAKPRTQQEIEAEANKIKEALDNGTTNTQEAIDKLQKLLTEKELLYVESYISNGGNKTLAYKTAGYKCKNENTSGVRGYQLFKKNKIKILIELRQAEILQKIRENTLITREAVLNNVYELAIRAGKPDAIECNGKVISLYQPQAAVRAWELIGSEIADMFKGKVEITNKDAWTQRYNQINQLKTELSKRGITQVISVQ